MKFHPLETIVEELEQAEQSGRHHTTDEEDEDFPVPIDLEAEPAEVQSEEDEVRLGVMRARRRKSCQGSRSSGQSPNNWPPLRVRHSQYEKIPQQSHNSYSRSEGKKTRTRTFQKSTNGTLRKMVSLWCSFFHTRKVIY